MSELIERLKAIVAHKRKIKWGYGEGELEALDEAIAALSVAPVAAEPDGEVRDIISSLRLMAEEASNWMDEHECADCKDGHLCSDWYSAVAASVVAPKAIALIKSLCDNQRSIPRPPSQRNVEAASGSLLAGSTHSKDALAAADYYHRNPSMALIAWDKQMRPVQEGPKGVEPFATYGGRRHSPLGTFEFFGYLKSDREPAVGAPLFMSSPAQSIPAAIDEEGREALDFACQFLRDHNADSTAAILERLLSGN